MAAGEIDADAWGRGVAEVLAPAGELAAGLAEDPLAEGHDQAGFLGDGDEFGGRDGPRRGWRQRTRTSKRLDLAGEEGDDGLVDEEEFLGVESLAEVGFEGEAVLQAMAHGGIEDGTLALAGEFGLVHGGVGVAEDLARRFRRQTLLVTMPMLAEE